MKRLIVIFVILFSVSHYAQRELEKSLSGYINPDEIVTLSESISFVKAIEVLSAVSEKLTGKTIVSTIELNEPIGIEIDKMPYKKALTVIVQYKNLLFEEKPEVIIIKTKSDEKATLTDDIYASIESREVLVSAVLFEANINDIRERGINWEALLSKTGLSLGGKLRTFASSSEQTESQSQAQGATQQVPPDFTIENKTNFTMGDFSGDASAAFKFFENENLGEIIARPSVTVRNKNKGRIQIGSDISIKERDFAGNLIDKFYSTGTIVEVTPYIYTEEGIDYILLKLMVERSTAEPGVISTEIRKTTANTEILMLNNEETIIGGLFVNQESVERRGIPILKDLPWWFFGLKYLFGYDSRSIEKKEIIILIKTEIIPTIKERLAQKKEENLIKSELKKKELEMDKYRKENLRED